MTRSFYFLFGGFPSLSQAELTSFAQALSFSPQMLSDQLVFVPQLTNSQLTQLNSRLGGTVKIAQFLNTFSSLEELIHLLTQSINQSTQKNLALSNYSSFVLPSKFISQLKASLHRNKPIRFLSFKTQHHSLVALRKQHVLEFCLFPHPNQTDYVLAQTVWIQDSDQWVKKDRQKPYQDIKRGMLPPKIARIMVNLATTGQPTGVLADPFCGTGTIALEAASLGYQIFASDLDAQAVLGTKINLIWLKEQFSFDFQFQVKVADAVHLSQFAPQLDFIVTEPFMGVLLNEQLQISSTKLANNIKGLNKLYKGALKDWLKVLKPRGRVVMIFPEFHLFNRVWRLPLIDTCENLGYNKLAELSYSKPKAKIVRKILILQKPDR